MHPVGRIVMHTGDGRRNPWRREATSLGLKFGIAGVVAFLAGVSIAVTFSGYLNHYVSEPMHIQWIDLVIIGLLFWILFLLVISYRRWQEAVVTRSELENIISSISPDALLVATPDRDIIMCNSSVQRMFGYDADDIIGKKTEMLYFDRRSRPDQPREIYEALQQDGFHVGYARGKRSNGEVFPLEIIAADLSGRAGAVLLLRDITERVEAEERRKALEKRVQLQQKMESLGILSSGVAHDFNNLLTVIQGNVEILERAVSDDADGKSSLTSILSATERAAALCHQMLAYSGEGEATMEPLDLGELVNKTARLLGVSIGTDISLHCQLNETMPPVLGDPVQLQQVVMNLVINAAESMEHRKGKIMLSVGLRRFDAGFLREQCLENELEEGEYAFLTVSDTGCGIDPETLLRIFDPFFTTKSSGRGLGLASVVGVVKSHGGALGVASELKQGTTFTLVFPVDA